MMQAAAQIDGQWKDVTIFVGRRKQDQAPKCMDPNSGKHLDVVLQPLQAERLRHGVAGAPPPQAPARDRA